MRKIENNKIGLVLRLRCKENWKEERGKNKSGLILKVEHERK